MKSVRKRMEKSPIVSDLAVRFLRLLGKKKPSQQHIRLTEKLLSTAVVNEHLILDERLTEREQNCLLLAAKGYTTEETAKILNVKPSTVETHRHSIINKLSCSNMSQAIFEGIRMGRIEQKNNYSN